MTARVQCPILPTPSLLPSAILVPSSLKGLKDALSECCLLPLPNRGPFPSLLHFPSNTYKEAVGHPQNNFEIPPCLNRKKLHLCYGKLQVKVKFNYSALASRVPALASRVHAVLGLVLKSPGFGDGFIGFWP